MFKVTVDPGFVEFVLLLKLDFQQLILFHPADFPCGIIKKRCVYSVC